MHLKRRDAVNMCSGTGTMLPGKPCALPLFHVGLCSISLDLPQMGPYLDKVLEWLSKEELGVVDGLL